MPAHPHSFSPAAKTRGRSDRLVRGKSDWQVGSTPCQHPKLDSRDGPTVPENEQFQKPDGATVPENESIELRDGSTVFSGEEFRSSAVTEQPRWSICKISSTTLSSAKARSSSKHARVRSP